MTDDDRLDLERLAYDPPPQPEGDGAADYTPLPLTRWGDLPEPDAQRWIIPDWLPAGALTLLSGAGGVGKSQLALQLAIAAAAGGPQAAAEWGGPALDPYIAEGCPVVFATWEDRPAATARRLSRLSGPARPWVTPDALLYLAGDASLGLTGAGPLWSAGPYRGNGAATQLTTRLQTAAAGVNAGLLVIDSLAAVFADNENDRAAVRGFLAGWDAWAARNDCAVLLLAHPPKSGADYSGSTDWLAGVRAMWTLGKEKHGPGPKRGQADNRPTSWRLECVKSNYAESGPPDPLRLEWGGPALESVGRWDDPAADAQPEPASANGAQAQHGGWDNAYLYEDVDPT